MTESQNPWTPPEEVPAARPTPAAAPAAWYPDGVDTRLRYWDGAAWTEHYAEPAAAQPIRPSTQIRPSTPMHPAALAALLIGGLTLVTVLVVVVVYFIGVPTAPIVRIHTSTGTSSLQS